MNLQEAINLTETFDAVSKLITGKLSKSGSSYKTNKKIGYVKYTMADGSSIVWDGVGIEAFKNNKSIGYWSGQPKLDYKQAIQKVIG